MGYEKNVYQPLAKIKIYKTISMKYFLVITILLLISCSSGVENIVKDNKSLLNKDSIRFSSEEIHLMKVSVFERRILITIKNNTPNDYYVECFNQRERKIPMIKAITKAQEISTKYVHLGYFPDGLDTVIVLKSMQEKEFLIGNNIKTDQMDTVYAETYYRPVVQGKNQKLIMHFAIKENSIKRFYNPNYLDGIRLDSLMHEIVEKKE